MRQLYNVIILFKLHTYEISVEENQRARNRIRFLPLFPLSGHHVFASDSHTDMEEWMSTMQEAIMEDRQRNRRKKAQSVILQQSADRNQSLAMPGTTAVPIAITQKAQNEATMYEPSNSGTEYNTTTKIKRRHLVQPTW